MHYATIDNQIGSASTIPEGAVEISKERYRELMDAKTRGERVTVDDGEPVTYKGPVYAPDGTERKERDPDESLITEAPPEDLHVPKWEDGKWAESETDEQRAEREAKELDNARTRAYSRIEKGHADALATIKARYPQLEREGWHELVQDAQAGEGECLEAYAADLGVTVADAATRVLDSRSSYRQAYGHATGKLTALRDQIDSAETVSELEAIVWPAS